MLYKEHVARFILGVLDWNLIIFQVQLPAEPTYSPPSTALNNTNPLFFSWLKSFSTPTVLDLQVSKEPLEVERSTGLFDANSELFKKTIMISMAMLSCGIMLGLCWEVMYRIRKKRKVEPHSQGNSIHSSNWLLAKLWPAYRRSYGLHRLQPSLPPAAARFFASIFTAWLHYYLWAWNRLTVLKLY